MSRGQLFVVTAPSGAGKSTLIEILFDRLDRLAFSVSWTTRDPRPGEQEGREYHFTDAATFRRKVAAGDFLEWAIVHDHYYGTARTQVGAQLDEGLDVILDIDVQGAEQVRRTAAECTTIFIMPPDYETLRQRLLARGTDSKEATSRRLRNAGREVRRFEEFDYIVINDDLPQAAEELIAVFQAARVSRARRTDEARRIVESFPSEEDAGGEGPGAGA